MTPIAFAAFALGLPAATVTVQWGGSQVYKVGGKMFAVLGGAVGGGGFALKASAVAFAVLSESGAARPAPYLARAGWLRIEDLAGLEAEEVSGWLANAHALVAARLTRALRAELGL